MFGGRAGPRLPGLAALPKPGPTEGELQSIYFRYFKCSFPQNPAKVCPAAGPGPDFLAPRPFQILSLQRGNYGHLFLFGILNDVFSRNYVEGMFGAGAGPRLPSPAALANPRLVEGLYGQFFFFGI